MSDAHVQIWELVIGPTACLSWWAGAPSRDENCCSNFFIYLYIADRLKCSACILDFLPAATRLCPEPSPSETTALSMWLMGFIYVYMISNESYVSPRVTPLFILLCSCFVCRKVRVWKATWESALGQTFVLPKRSPTPTACHSMSSCSVSHLAKALSQTWQNGPVHHISRWYLIQLQNNTKICYMLIYWFPQSLFRIRSTCMRILTNTSKQ